jgi:hypothetical protein
MDLRLLPNTLQNPSKVIICRRDMSFGCAKRKTGGQCLGTLVACRCQFWEELNFQRVSKLDGTVCGFHNFLCGFVYLGDEMNHGYR